MNDGIVGKGVLCSGEAVTEFTAMAERQTENLTGIQIDKGITAKTLRLKPLDGRAGGLPPLHGKIRCLNRKALGLLDGLISFKESILKAVLQGELFTVNYPLLIEHIIREAKLYRKYVELLEREGDLLERLVKENECFWNQIMMEHAQFIRGLLDPCETELFCTAEILQRIFAGFWKPAETLIPNP